MHAINSGLAASRLQHEVFDRTKYPLPHSPRQRKE